MAGSSKEGRLTRILFVSGTVPPAPCGVGDYTFRLAQSLARIDNAETAILTGVTAAIPEGARDVPIFPILNSWKLSQVFRVIRFLKFWKPHVVHVQYPTQGYGRGWLPYIVPLTARFMGVRSVQTWHEGFGRRHTGRLILLLSADSRKIVVRGNFLDCVDPRLRWVLKFCKLSFIANASAIPRASCSKDELLDERRLLLQGQRRLIVFFGFLYPPKGVELLFEIADPVKDHVVIAGPAEKDSSYLAMLKAAAAKPEWQGKVTFTGFVSPERASVLLAASDAVILPFRQGGGPWNTSIHSASLNGCFVITTSKDRTGYDESSNVFYSRPDDIAEMRRALALHCQQRDNFIVDQAGPCDDWDIIARKHYLHYQELVAFDS